ncbi:hypothetical protein [Streptomyces bathyalis]|uniref:hypothetical protein n=1 Tax=Streptomyces bathyalis TaxID=2710756 RepID=UPI001FE88C2C|nr:hypothetical protein [Streptomyces bathyalis]
MPITRRSGEEPLEADGEVQGVLLDFWRWSCSDLANNTMRGVLAEYIVALALGAASGTRMEWDSVDIRTREGWRVEVKSSAYLQSWAQSKKSSISFSIGATFGWNQQTGEYLAERSRRSDAYVFCLLQHQHKQSLDPLNIDQWDFYVLATEVLDKACPEQKTITLTRLLGLEPERTDFAGLRQAVARCLTTRTAP